MTSSLLAHRGKMEPQTPVFSIAFLHGCISTPTAALLPAIPVSMAGKGQEEGREGALGMEGSIGMESRAGSVGSRGAAARPRWQSMLWLCRRCPVCSRAPTAPLHPQATRIFAFPGLADKAASPLIRRPGEWDQRKAGVLQS